MIYINRFFLNIFDQIRKFYLNSKFYDKKISYFIDKNFIYKPSPHFLSSLIRSAWKACQSQSIQELSSMKT